MEIKEASEEEQGNGDDEEVLVLRLIVGYAFEEGRQRIGDEETNY